MYTHAGPHAYMHACMASPSGLVRAIRCKQWQSNIRTDVQEHNVQTDSDQKTPGTNVHIHVCIDVA